MPKSARKRSNSYVEDLHEQLKDPAFASEYLNAVLQDSEDDVEAVFLLALRDVLAANGVGGIAKKAQVNRENLYRALSKRGNPTVSTMFSILRAIGLRFRIETATAGPVSDKSDQSAAQSQISRSLTLGDQIEIRKYIQETFRASELLNKAAVHEAAGIKMPSQRGVPRIPAAGEKYQEWPFAYAS